ncbi:hypothetical protein Tco_0803159 [Tanacetum coccineum]|uniref:Zinc finger, CCHC-type n=1 Tax=Tanacetum coccineum TaxID=301880 RepID=A0ABQ5A3A8_9ASTR
MVCMASAWSWLFYTGSFAFSLTWDVLAANTEHVHLVLTLSQERPVIVGARWFDLSGQTSGPLQPMANFFIVAFYAINARRLPLALLVYTLVRPPMTTSVVTNSVFKGFFEKQKLTGPNFIDWYRQLRIVLSVEDKLDYLEQPIPPAPVPAQAGQQVAPEALAAHTAWVKGSKEIVGLMLMTMEPDIQRNLENLSAYDMLQELKTLFAQQAEQELLQTVRDFHSCKQEEGQSVSSYVLKMKSYIDNLERLGHPVSLNLGVSLILISLRKEFDSFVQNYNMHSMGKTVNELHAMLKLHEQTLTKKDPALHAIRAGKVIGRGTVLSISRSSEEKKKAASGRTGGRQMSLYFFTTDMVSMVSGIVQGNKGPIKERRPTDRKLFIHRCEEYELGSREFTGGGVGSAVFGGSGLRGLNNTVILHGDYWLRYERCSEASSTSGAVDWKSAKQSIFATSSLEAEYIDAFNASKESVWVRKFIFGLGVVLTIEKPINMYCDNTGAIAIANESGITKGARHFRAKVHYLREVIEFGEIMFKRSSTDDKLC